MIPSFTTELLSIGALYSAPNYFCTPAFQRRYSWTTKEAGQLLEDIRQAAETGHSQPSSQTADYFLGTIVLLRARTVNGNGVGASGSPDSLRQYDIIDGQQRLVTLTILLSVLRDLDGADETSSAASLHDHIQAEADDGATGNLRYCIALDGQDGTVLAEHVQRPGASNTVPDYTVQSKGSLRILEVRDYLHDELHDMESEGRNALADYLLARCAFVVIATSDIDRAYQMFTVLNHRGKPLDRADIIKARLIGDLPASEHDRFSLQWKELQEKFGDNYETLFSHIRTIHGHHRGRIVSELMDIVADAGGARPFIDNVVQPLAVAYKRIVTPNFQGSPELVEAYSRLTYLNWLRGKDWMPAAMLWLSRHPGDPDKTKQFLTALDRLAFGLLLLGMGTVKRKNRYRAVLRDIQDNVPVLTANSPLALERSEQRNILYNVSHNLYGRSQQACKLALLRLNDDIAGKPQNLEPTDFTVEHILPLKLSNASRWREWYTVADAREYCTQCLGNLTLIRPSENDRAGNKDFAQKSEIYFPANAPSGTHLTDMLRGLEQWREEQVMARDVELLDRLKAIWQLAGPSGRKGARARTGNPKQVQQSPLKQVASR